MTLEQFLEKLRETPRDWRYVDTWRMRRGGKSDRTTYHCPISAVRGDGFAHAGAPRLAGEVLGLHPQLADKIILAADALPKHDPTLREQLKEACGLP